MTENFDEIKCLKENINFEWFYLNWTNKNKEGNTVTGVCCFFIYAWEDIMDCAVLMISHDVKNKETKYKTYLPKNYIDFCLKFKQGEDEILKNVKKAVLEMYRHEETETVNEIIGKSNFKYNNATLEISAYGFFIKKVGDLYEFEVKDHSVNQWGEFKCKCKPVKKYVDIFNDMMVDNNSTFEYLTYSRCEIIHEADNLLPGIGHFDHQWGKFNDSVTKYWNWSSSIMDNNIEIYYYNISDESDEFIIIDENGKTTRSICQSEVTKWWISPYTFKKYPKEITLNTDNYNLIINTNYNNQEIETVLVFGCFYEGGGHSILVNKLTNEETSGICFVEYINKRELKLAKFKENFDNCKIWMEKLLNKSFYYVNENQFKAENYIPNNPFFGKNGHKSYNKNFVDVVKYSLQNGSVWRSGLLMVMFRMLTNSTSTKKIGYLISIFIELTQTGSLMIDDFQDHSEIRRNIPCTYKVYGENVTLMAALVLTTKFKSIVDKCAISPQLKLDLYSEYFIGSSQFYLGQLEDVSSLSTASHIEELCKCGQSPDLEDEILRKYALKTGSPIGLMFKFAGLICGVDAHILNILYDVGVILGIAYQIIDDLHDYDSSSSKKGEDIKEHKITYPFLMALPSMSFIERSLLFERFTKSSIDQHDIDYIISTVTKYNGIKQTKNKAKLLIQEGWLNLTTHMKPSTGMVDFYIYITSFLADIGEKWD